MCSQAKTLDDLRTALRLVLLLASVPACRFDARIPSTKSPPTSSNPANTPTTQATLSISDGATYNFGNATVGNTSDKTFTISNTGDGSATAMSANFSSSNFTLKGGSYPGTGGTCLATLATGATCSLVTTFTPQSSGTKNDSLTLSFGNGSTDTTTTRAVSGVGLSAASLSISGAATYDYGEVSVSASSDATFTVTNSGETTATEMSGGSFVPGTHFNFKNGTYPGTGGDCGATLIGNGNTCFLVVTFTPLGGGALTDTVSLTYSTGVAATTATRSLQGNGNVLGPAGTLDTSFSTDGFANADLTATNQTAEAIISQSNGKLVVGGKAASNVLLISRFSRNGVLDTTFYTSGKNNTNYGSPGNQEVLDLEITSSGLIYGAIRNPATPSQNAVYRFTTDGAIDTSFNTDGIALVSIVGEALDGPSIVLQSNGKAIFQSIQQTSSLRYVFRFETDGTLDTTFSTDGKLSWVRGGTSSSWGLGKIRLDTAGRAMSINMETGVGYFDTSIVRFTTQGQLDTAFNTGGSLTTTMVTSGVSLTVDTMGRTIAVGTNIPAGTATFAAMRILTDGQVDTTFHTDGQYVLPALTGGAGRAIIAQGSKIVLYGIEGAQSARAARLSSSGVLDTSFATDGDVNFLLSGFIPGWANDFKIQSTTGSFCGVANVNSGAAATIVGCFTP